MQEAGFFYQFYSILKRTGDMDLNHGMVEGLDLL